MTITITIQNSGPIDSLDCIVQSDVPDIPFAKVVSMLETITVDMFDDYMTHCRHAMQEYGAGSPDEMEKICMLLPLPRTEHARQIPPPGPQRD